MLISILKTTLITLFSDITSLTNGSVHAHIQLDQRTIAEVSPDRLIHIISVKVFTIIDQHLHSIVEMSQIDCIQLVFYFARGSQIVCSTARCIFKFISLFFRLFYLSESSLFNLNSGSCAGGWGSTQ